MKFVNDIARQVQESKIRLELKLKKRRVYVYEDEKVLAGYPC